MNIYSVFYIVILLLVIFSVSYFVEQNIEPPSFAELGYSDTNDEYIYPVVYNNFIDQNEANYILKNATPKFEESQTIGGGVDVQTRKSKTAWLDKNDPVVKTVILRVCEIHGHSFENAEHLQVVKYGPNGFYNPHHDSTGDENKESAEFLQSGGHRVLTMLIYLNDDFTGGSTRFVNLERDVKPPKHGSILFFPLDKHNRRCHPKALHAGLPLESGEKYIANVWIRQGPFTNPCD